MTRIYVIDVGNEFRTEDVSSWRDAGVTRFEVFRAEAIRSFTSSAEPPDLVLIYGDDARGTLLIPRIAAVWPQTPLAVCSTAPSVSGAIAAIRVQRINGRIVVDRARRQKRSAVQPAAECAA